MDPHPARLRQASSRTSRVNWLYQTEPEPELNDRIIYQPRGKVLGGSSSINGLVYIRGQPEDFDQWRQLGNAGWGFEDVLPYFKRSEDQARGESALHGVGGPLCVSDATEPHELCDAFIAAAEAGGRSAQRRFQRAGPGRRRLFPDHLAARHPLEHGARLSAPGAQAPEPRGHDRGARDARASSRAARLSAWSTAAAARFSRFGPGAR